MLARSITITVDRLAQQYYLAAALFGQNPGLGQDLLRWPSLLRTTRHRHHAIGAEFVAPDLDPQVSLIRGWTHGWIAQRIKCLVTPFDLLKRTRLAIQAHRQLLPLPGLGKFQQLRNAMQLTWPHHQVDVRDSVKDLLLLLLRHTP